MKYNYYVDHTTGLIYRVSVSALKHRVSSQEKIPIKFLHVIGSNLWENSAEDYDTMIKQRNFKPMPPLVAQHLATVGYDKDYFSRV